MNASKTRQYRIIAKILFWIYIGFVFYFLLISEIYGRTGEMQEYHYNFVLFQEIMRFWNYREQLGIFPVFANLAGNILIFIPFGFFVPMSRERKSILATTIGAFLLSLVIESIQLYTRVGCFDVDDLLLNTVGGISGYIGYRIISGLHHLFSKKR